MKKQIMDEKNFRRMEYEFGEYKDSLPAEWSQVTERALNVLRPHFYYELPLSRELNPIIQKLIYDQYPAFRGCERSWHLGWIREICEQAAELLADDITSMFMCVETDENLPALYEDFESQVRFYARPHEPKEQTVSDFDELPITDEEKQVIIRERYEEEKAECDLHNRLHSAFINAVQPTIFKYFGERTDNMDVEIWNLYGITLGYAFYRFNDDCLDMEYMLEYDDLTEHSGMSFYQYNEIVKADFKSENNIFSEQYEQIKKIG